MYWRWAGIDGPPQPSPIISIAYLVATFEQWLMSNPGVYENRRVASPEEFRLMMLYVTELVGAHSHDDDEDDDDD